MRGRTDSGSDGRNSPRYALTVGVSWRFIALATAGVLALITVFNISVRVARAFYVTAYQGSGRLITPTLIGGVALFAVTVIGLASCSRLWPGDVGWRRSKIGSGLAMTAGVWIAMQIS